MTPYTSSAPVTKPATPPPSYQAKDTPRPEKKQVQETSESSVKSYLTENESDISAADSSAFAEMMASLLGMPSLAQAPLPVNTGIVANDTVAAISVNAAPTETASPRVGATFSMDPAFLILPQDVSSASALIPPSDSSFSTELMTALTPGIPVPAETSVTTAVAVPVIASDLVTTPSLTVDKAIEADPRLIASGFDPAQLGALKEKISPAKNLPSDTSSPVTAINAAAHAKPASSDTGIITVTFQPPEIPVSANQSAPVGNVAVAVATQMSAAQATSVATTATTAAVNIQTETPIDVDADLLAAIEPGTEDLSGTDAGFDPVEYRIAQRFQGPVSQTTSQAAAPQPEAPATPAAQQPTANATPSPVTPHAEAAVKGKIAAQIDNTAALSSSSALLASSSPTSLTASPIVLPATVTPMTIASSPVAQSSYASQTHPAIQTVAAAIARNAKESGPQTISLRLDPPELGKLQVEMKYKKGDPLKVHVVLEKADTASLFQKDAYALESALKDAGVQMDGSSLSFEFSQDNSAFRQTMEGKSSSGSSRASAGIDSAAESAIIESSVDIYTDNKTGLTHYNLRV